MLHPGSPLHATRGPSRPPRQKRLRHKSVRFADCPKTSSAGEQINCYGQYFKAFVRPDKLLFQPTFYSRGNEVILHGQEAVQAIDSKDVISSWIFIKFTFERGKLIRYENFYDTATAAYYLKSLGDPQRRLPQEGSGCAAEGLGSSRLRMTDTAPQNGRALRHSRGILNADWHRPTVVGFLPA